MRLRVSGHHSGRRSIRLPEYDYSQPGGYFITISTHHKFKIFGALDGERVALNQFGLIAKKCWEEIPNHFSHVIVDALVAMPDHIHGILFITGPIEHLQAVGAQHAAPLYSSGRYVKSGSLGAIVRSYKAAVTKAIHMTRIGERTPVWQRNYYERVIRNDRELESIRHYITYNYMKPLSF